MNVAGTLTSIAVANRPRQLDLLASIATILQDSPAVTDILVRGSFAAGKADRSSDVDLVIGVTEAALSPFLAMLDTLMRVELGALFPGWRDSLVSSMGGWGYVFLVPGSEALYELDLYVVPSAGIGAIIERGATAVFSRAETAESGIDPVRPDSADGPGPNPSEADVARDLLVEILVLLHMMSKRVSRGQSFIVYGQSYLLNDAVRRLIKHCLAPWSRHWGWYHLEEDLAADPIGNSCLKALAALVSAPPIHDHEGIQHVFTQVEHVIALAAPQAWSDLASELETYRHHMGIR